MLLFGKVFRDDQIGTSGNTLSWRKKQKGDLLYDNVKINDQSLSLHDQETSQHFHLNMWLKYLHEVKANLLEIHFPCVQLLPQIIQ